MATNIAQSFTIDTTVTAGNPGVYINAVDVYFKSCDPVLGVTVSIIPMTNGIPDFISAPLGSKRLAPISSNNVLSNTSPISISSDSSTATTFIFDDVIYLPVGNQYAISILPDGYNVNYVAYTAKIGQKDLRTSQSVTNNWGLGQLFPASTTGNTVVPSTSEVLKFNLYCAKYSALAGSITLTNDNTEYLTIGNVSSAFSVGEWVYMSGANTGNISFSSNSSLIVSNSNTAFANVVSGNQLVLVGYSATANAVLNSVVTINTINANNTLTVLGYPTFSSANAQYQKTPVGKVSFFSAGDAHVYLANSSASNTAWFASGNTIIGATSKCTANVVSVDNKVINTFQPFMSRTIAQGTNVTLNLGVTSTSGTALVPQVYDFTATTELLTNDVAVYSYSNELKNLSGAKSLQATLNLSSTTSALSPIVNLDNQNLVTYHNIINNDTTNENLKTGNALSKYVSKTVTLSPGLDSEDLHVYVTAHKPAGTNIAVYAKILNSADPDTFDSKDWTLLTQITPNNIVSNSLDMNDMYEFAYHFNTSLPGTIIPGTVSVATGSTVVTGTNTFFSNTYSNNSMIEIVSSGGVAQIATVASVTSNTVLTLASNSVFSDIAASAYTVTTPHAAYLNQNNSGIVRYYGATGTVYDSFISFAIKIDLLSSGISSIVPAIKDVRAIALSV